MKWRSALPTFHGPVILPYILNTARWICLILGIIVQCVNEIDHMLPVGQCDLYFTVQWLLLKTFIHQIHHRCISKAWFRWATLSCDSSYLIKVHVYNFLPLSPLPIAGECSYGPRQANLVLIAYASSEGSGQPAHPRSLARTFAARSYKQWVKRNLQTESQISGPSEWLGMRS